MGGVLDWNHATTEVAESGTKVARQATPEERLRLADELKLLGCDRLAVSYVVRPFGMGRFRLTGTLNADVTQACIVTLEPVPSKIDTVVEVEFWPPDLQPDAPNAEVEILKAPEIEPIANGRIDVGRVVFESLATALDPYPRQSGARFDWEDPLQRDGGKANPFAVLAKLKDKG